MKIGLSLKGAPLVKARLDMLGEDAKHARTIAVTMLGESAQRAMQTGMASRFTFRGTEQLFKKAVIFQRPKATTKRAVTASLVVGTDGPMGTKATASKRLGQILARHEEEDTRTESSQVYFNGKGQAMTGLGFFLPAKGMRTGSSNPARKLYPSSIGSTLRLTPDSKLILAKGTKKGSKKKGTGVSYFATRQGIFRRKHSSFGGRVDVEALWWFRSKVRTPARLGLWKTANDVFEKHGADYTMQAIDTVMRRST